MWIIRSGKSTVGIYQIQIAEIPFRHFHYAERIGRPTCFLQKLTMLVIIEDILHHPHKSILAQPIVLIYRIGRLIPTDISRPLMKLSVVNDKIIV